LIREVGVETECLRGEGHLPYGDELPREYGNTVVRLDLLHSRSILKLIRRNRTRRGRRIRKRNSHAIDVLVPPVVVARLGWIRDIEGAGVEPPARPATALREFGEPR